MFPGSYDMVLRVIAYSRELWHVAGSYGMFV